MKLGEATKNYLYAFLANGNSPTSTESYKYYHKRWISYMGDPEVETITTDQLRKFFYHLHTETRLSPLTIQKFWTTIRSFYNWAGPELGIKRPDDGIPKPKGSSKAVVPFVQFEIIALLKACNYTVLAETNGRKPFCMPRPTALRDKAMVLLFVDTGLRSSEVARLRISDLDLRKGELFVQPYLSGVKSKSRTVYIGRITAAALLNYLTRRGGRGECKDMDPLFAEWNNAFMTRDAIYNVISNIGKRAGVRDTHPHRFRHTFAIQLLRNGGDIFSLQRLLGHSSLEMVQHYLAIVQSDAANAHHKAGPVDRWALKA